MVSLVDVHFLKILHIKLKCVVMYSILAFLCELKKLSRVGIMNK
jgi:hypothetical protein